MPFLEWYASSAKWDANHLQMYSLSWPLFYSNWTGSLFFLEPSSFWGRCGARKGATSKNQLWFPTLCKSNLGPHQRDGQAVYASFFSSFLFFCSFISIIVCPFPTLDLYISLCTILVRLTGRIILGNNPFQLLCAENTKANGVYLLFRNFWMVFLFASLARLFTNLFFHPIMILLWGK